MKRKLLTMCVATMLLAAGSCIWNTTGNQYPNEEVVRFTLIHYNINKYKL